MSRICDNSRFIKKQFIDEQQDQVFEFERGRFSDMHLGADVNNQSPHFGTSLEELMLSEGSKFLAYFMFIFRML